MNPIAIVFGVLVSFVLGIATGLTLAKWLVAMWVRGAHCDDFHALIERFLAEHSLRRGCHMGLVDLVKPGVIHVFDREGP